MTVSRNKRVMIMSSANRPTEEKDMADIEAGFCIHCHRGYEKTVPLVFVRLGTGELIWWHQNSARIDHCQSVEQV